MGFAAIPRRRPLRAATLVLSAVVLAAACSSLAFVSSSQTPSRREALQGLAGAVAATFGTQAAWADAYGSKPWALSKYGPVIVKLKDAVEAGDMKKVLKRESSFKALNGYWMFSPQEYGKKNKLVDDILLAAEEGNTAKVKELYTEYMADDVMQQFAALKPRNQGKIMNVGTAMFTGQIRSGGALASVGQEGR
eukprot:TRINITY_DN10395_c0_g1_i1.p1 TRINITY_DN10395_c0_g1~~TRINITY_DN10395_c0_g1_i1.p1  ORF type:complete len:193 (+),score=45.52 TRINITY_DN10395_c0_g1_i1:71-649(+)